MAHKQVQESGKRLGVCLNAYSDNNQLIEAAITVTRSDGCPWFAVYIDDDRYELDSLSRERLRLSIDKAREAGAEIIRLPSDNIVQGIITAAELNHLTHLIIGKRQKSTLKSFLRPTLASRLIRQNASFEIQVITLDQVDEDSVLTATRGWQGYAISTLLICVLTIVIDVIQESLPEYRFNASIYNVSMVYLLAIIFSALRYGVWPAVLAALLSFAFYNYFFIPPFYEFGLNGLNDVLNFGLFLAASLVSVTLADRYKRKMTSLKERELAARALQDLTKDIGSTSDRSEIIQLMALNLQEILHSEVVIFLKNANLEKVFPLDSRQHTQDVASIFREQKVTHTQEWAYYPISTPRKRIGILGVAANGGAHSERLVEALAYHIGLAIERSELMQESEDIKLKHQRESLRSSLLSSVSHDLKTPLVSIIGSLSSIRHMDDALTTQERRELITTAIEEAERLNQSITNILDMTKIESGDMKINAQWLDVHSVFSDAIGRMFVQLGDRELEITLPYSRMAIKVDPVLFSQVLQNLLENIVKYTPPDAKVTLGAVAQGPRIRLHITDNGPGIPEEDRNRLFDKFTRLEKRDARIAGTGLGLSICKAIVELHEGTIRLENNENDVGVSAIITLKKFKSIEKETEE